MWNYCVNSQETLEEEPENCVNKTMYKAVCHNKSCSLCKMFLWIDNRALEVTDKQYQNKSFSDIKLYVSFICGNGFETTCAGLVQSWKTWKSQAILKMNFQALEKYLNSVGPGKFWNVYQPKHIFMTVTEPNL